MALQIAPIKASRRKILQGLNAEHYERTQKSRQTQGVGQGRRKLVNPQTARKVASQKTRRQLERQSLGRGETYSADYRRGENLKKGIEALARRADDVSDLQRAKLSRMDPAKLDEMYQANDLIFEVYFQYDTSKEGYKTLSDKSSDVQFLIDQYEARFGVIEV